MMPSIALESTFLIALKSGAQSEVTNLIFEFPTEYCLVNPLVRVLEIFLIGFVK